MMKNLFLFLGLVLGLGSGLTAYSQLSFRLITSEKVEGKILFTKIVDMDNDGLQDVVYIYFNSVFDSSNIMISISSLDKNNMNYSLKEKQRFSSDLNSKYYCRSFDIKDLNNDQYPEIVLSLEKSINLSSGDINVNYLLIIKNDQGSIDNTTVQTLDSAVQCINELKIVDFNDDGKQEIILLGDSLRILYPEINNTGLIKSYSLNAAGSFIAWDGSGIPGFKMEFADLNSDGREDVVIEKGGNSLGCWGDCFDKEVLVLFQDQNHDFNNSLLLGSGKGLSGTITADIDNDGEIEIASIFFYSISDSSLEDSRIKIWKDLKLSTSIKINNTSMTLKIANLDNDNKPDFVWGNNEERWTLVTRTNNDADLKRWPSPKTNKYGYMDIEIGDINNDGLDDAILPNINTGEFIVM
ncbi:MAG: VCBS repeat-containing protein, partial [Planctomycetes bacterium]|nr:VCBS repeat-containing protein [Planctomycetota bacterium]